MKDDNRAAALPQPPLLFELHSVELAMQVIHYIMENLHADLSVSNLARRLSLKERVLLCGFESQTGVALGQFVLRRRIERALDLLKSSSATDSEIAVGIGLKTASAFRTVFFNYLGVSPTEYRRILPPKKEPASVKRQKRPCKSVSIPVKKPGGEALRPLVV